MTGRRSTGASFGLLILAVVGFLLAGCGEGRSPGSGDSQVRLVLDFVPNGVHAGIYRAIAAGYYEEEGIDLEVVPPSSTGDTVRLVLAGKAEVGIADGLDFAGQVSLGRDVRAVMSILDRPAGGLITLKEAGVGSPAELAGRTVGETGVESDRIVFQTMVESAGGDPEASKVVATGFNGAQALVAGRIDAFTGYIPADATALDLSGERTRSFAFDRFGGPSYPGLVAFGSGSWLEREPELARGFVEATVRGYRDAIASPGKAIDDLSRQVDGVDPAFARAVFLAYRPLFGSSGGFGRIDPASIRTLSDFMVSTGLAERPVSPDDFGAPGLATGPLD
jgi:ABC-type nitrate/sulfonate/bicarbonate transport system substrate-binding protein